jgi:hypothetical protein
MEPVILPAGTSFVLVDQISSLIANALHPKPEDAACVIKEIRKISLMTLDQDSISYPLTAADSELLLSICGTVPQAGERISKLEWTKYVATVERSERRPSWGLGATWTDVALNNSILRAAARARHMALLRDAFAERTLVSTDRAGIPTLGRISPNARIGVRHFSKYAAQFNVRVIVRRGKSVIPWKQPRAVNWIDFAIATATRIHNDDPRLNGMGIANQVLALMKAEGIGGRGGKVLTAETIRRKALKGIKPRGNSWHPNCSTKSPIMETV